MEPFPLGKVYLGSFCLCNCLGCKESGIRGSNDLQEPTGRHRCRAYMNRTLATAVLGISPEMQLLELIDQAARRGTSEDTEEIYRRDATATGIYDRVRANLPADKMREFNLLARNAAKTGRKVVQTGGDMPGTGASTKGRRRTEERVYHRPFRDRVEQSAEIFLISLFCGDKMDRYVVGYRVRQGAHFYPVSFNALNLFELNGIAQGKQGSFEKPLTHTCRQRNEM